MGTASGKCVAWAILVVGILASVGYGANPAEEKVSQGTVHKLKGDHTGFAFNPNTGDVAAIGKKESMVIYSAAFFDGQSTKVRTIDLPVLPSAIAYKRLGSKDHWVIGTAKGDLLLLDATTGKVITRGLVAKPIGKIVTPDLADDPAVFASFAGRGDGARPGNIIFADARDFKSAQEKTMPTTRFGSDVDIALSLDGKRLYCARRSSSPSGVGFVRIEKGPSIGSPIVLKEGRYEHDSALGPYVLGPYNRKMYVGLKCWSAEMLGKDTASKLPATPHCIFRKRPILIGANWRAREFYRSRRSTSSPKILAIDVRTLETVGTIPVPKEMATDMGLSGREYKPTGWFADDRGKRLVVISPSLAYVVSLSSVKVPKAPYLYPSVKYDAPLLVGKPARLSVEPVSPGCKLSLVKGPKGMILRDGKLRWTPGDDDVGRVKIDLKVSYGSVDQVTPIWVDVVQEGVTLPFVVTHMAASPDGDYVVAWDGPGYATRRTDGRQAKIALIHLPTKTARITERPANPLAVAVDAHGVYIAMSNRSGMCVLDLKTLKEKQVLLTESPVKKLFTPVDGLLIISTLVNKKGYGSGRQTCRAYRTTPNLKEEVSMLTPKSIPHLPSYINPPLPMLHFEHPWISGRLNAGRAILKPDASATELLLGYTSSPHRSSWDRSTLGGWGCYLNGYQLMAAGRKVGSLPSSSGSRGSKESRGTTRILQNRPAVASVGTVTERGSRRERTSLLLFDLISGRIVQKSCMIDRVLPQYSRERSTGLLCETKTHLVVGKGSRVAFYPFSRIDKKKFPRPFQILWPRGIRTEIASTKRTQFKHTAVGGKGKVVFELSKETEGVKIDPATGTVTVDAPLLSRQAVAALTSRDYFNRMAKRGIKSGTVKDMVDQWVIHSSWSYTGLTGKTCSEFVKWVVIDVTATDAEGRLSRVNYMVAMMIPPSALTGRAKELLDQRAKMIAENEAARKAYLEEREKKARAQASPSSKQLQDRIRELEKENAALEAQVKLLKELLKNK